MLLTLFRENRERVLGRSSSTAIRQMREEPIHLSGDSSDGSGSGGSGSTSSNSDQSGDSSDSEERPTTHVSGVCLVSGMYFVSGVC